MRKLDPKLKVVQVSDCSYLSEVFIVAVFLQKTKANAAAREGGGAVELS